MFISKIGRRVLCPLITDSASSNGILPCSLSCSTAIVVMIFVHEAIQYVVSRFTFSVVSSPLVPVACSTSVLPDLSMATTKRWCGRLGQLLTLGKTKGKNLYRRKSDCFCENFKMN